MVLRSVHSKLMNNYLHRHHGLQLCLRAEQVQRVQSALQTRIYGRTHCSLRTAPNHPIRYVSNYYLTPAQSKPHHRHKGSQVSTVHHQMDHDCTTSYYTYEHLSTIYYTVPFCVTVIVRCRIDGDDAVSEARSQ